jgi:hypothetical protein
MKAALFFFQPLGRRYGTPLHDLYGRYNVGGFMFIHDTTIQAFMTRQGEVFTRYEWAGQGGEPMREGTMDILMLSVDEQEQARLLATCEACAEVKKPFNLQDLLLLYLPFYEVEELAFDTAPTLHNAQAVILILRECLRMDNRLREGLEGLHSRQTVLETLFDRLVPLTVPMTWAAIQGLVKWGVPVLPSDPRPTH